MTAEPERFDWRVPLVWAVMLTVSVFAHAYVEVANEASRGHPIGYGRALILETASHLVVAALLPALYWLHRGWPVDGPRRNILIHLLGLVPFSIAHTLGMAALRLLWFAGIAGERYEFSLTIDRLGFEFSKDIVNYTLLSAGVFALNHLLRRDRATAPSVPAPAAAPAVGSLADRFAVRKRGKEIMVEVADIDWVEAAGNYAVLHVGGETLEIRSSLSKLEGELDPKRFVRVHKSYVVNVARITEVTPWISGDWRIRLQDGAEVNLSRRYRQRFETLVPVKS
jgi:hypothetical protein